LLVVISNGKPRRIHGIFFLVLLRDKWFVLQAEDWSGAHEVLVSEIAPSSILSQDYSHLRTLLASLEPAHIADKVM
jgi:hypothetical protein